MRAHPASIPMLCLVTALGGFLATALLPAVQGTGGGQVLSAEERAGYEVYLREGCASCHTQQVRAVEAKFGVVRQPGDIGEASRASDYALQNPTALGLVRIGPDLAHVGARIRSAEEMERAIQEPQRRTPGGRMPPHPYLSGEELRALVAYLLSLR
jgi:cytochrome c oxidase cbb3-type subunit 2